MILLNERGAAEYMGKADIITKDYIRRPDIFADVFNQFLYHGIPKITSDKLVELDTTEIALSYRVDDTRRYIIEEYQKSEEEADELIKKYWK